MGATARPATAWRTMDELVSDFVIEAADSLAGLQGGVAALGRRPDDMAAARDMLRRLHGLKGLCGFIGLNRAEAVCHAAESLLTAFERGGAARPWPSLSLLAAGVERLSHLVGEVARSGVEPHGCDHDLITALELAALGAPVASTHVSSPDNMAVAPVLNPASRERRAPPPWRGLDGLARALGDRLSKRIDLSVSGEDLRVIASASGPIRNALVALVRNACDHGVEAPHERREAGKPAMARLHVRLARTDDGGVIDVTDDGHGVDPQRLRDEAVAGGLMTAAAAAALSDEAAQDLVFASGMSTSQTLDTLSGRGLGLDLVRREIQSLGGQVEMRSEPGRGARFSLILPAAVLASAAQRRLAAA